MKKNVIKNKKGFTLVEMLVAIFIFSMVMVSVGAMFASHINAYRNAKELQGDLENAQFALNFIAKTLRTSSLVGSGSSAGSKNDLLDGQVFDESVEDNYDNDFYLKEINSLSEGLIVYDYVQETCLIFTFRPAGYKDYAYPAIWMESQTNVPSSEQYRCIEDVYNNGFFADSVYKNKRLTTGNVTGSIFAAPTRYHNDYSDGRITDTVGRAVVALKVESTEATDDDDVKSVYLQTTVSLRDYPSDIGF